MAATEQMETMENQNEHLNDSIEEEEELVLKMLADQREDSNTEHTNENNESSSGLLIEKMQTDNEADNCQNSEHAKVVTYVPPKFDSVPSLIYEEEFAAFTKGVKFCSDGQTFAVCTDDKQIHLRRTDDLLDREKIPEKISVEAVATISEPQPIHEFAWNPQHEHCTLVTTCNTQPIHLYCGRSGKFLRSYVARNHLDEHISAYSVIFSRDGGHILGGFKKFVRIFDVECPGVWTEVATWKQYQAGIVSALDTVGDHLLAVGTYCNTVALYDLRDKGTMINEPEEGHEGGVTQVRFSYDGTLLYSGARKDNFIICRDLRNFKEILHRFPRKCTTNQRVHFDLPYEEDYLATGNTDGTCFIWNRRELEMFGEDKCRPNLIFAPHSDVRLTKSSATNGLSFHKWAPVIATSSGGRGTTFWDDENEQLVWENPYENCVKLWKFAQ